MLLTSAWTTLRPHAQQSRLWRCPDRFIAVRAARRSGKTTLLKRKLVRCLPQLLWHRQPGRYIYLAPTREQAKRIAWANLKALVHPSYLINILETELTIKTIWGSELHVGGFDKPQRFEGVPWDGAVVDESADIKPGAVDQTLRLALADRKGWLARIGVPKRVGVGATEFNQVCNDRSKGYTHFTWSAVDILDAAEIQNLADTLDPLDFAEQVYGIEVAAGGKAFSSFAADNVNQCLDQTVYTAGRTIVVGCDFNVTPMAWVLCHVYNNAIYVFDEIWLNNTNTRATLDELYRRYGRHAAGWLFMGDATGQARKTSGTAASQSDYLIIKQDRRFSSAGMVSVKFPKSNPRVKDRLASCNAMLCNAAGKRRLFISPTCRHLIEDLESRGLDDMGQPVDATKTMGHITDALGYVVHGLFPIHNYDTQLELDTDKESQPIEFVPIEASRDFSVFVG